MSPKHCSLAFDETVKEFESHDVLDNRFEPELKVIVTPNYKEPSLHHDIVTVQGRITVSF